MGPCFKCGQYGHHSSTYPNVSTQNTFNKRDYGNTTFIKTSNDAGFPVYILPSDPQILMQQKQLMQELLKKPGQKCKKQ